MVGGGLGWKAGQSGRLPDGQQGSTQHSSIPAEQRSSCTQRAARTTGPSAPPRSRHRCGSSPASPALRCIGGWLRWGDGRVGGWWVRWCGARWGGRWEMVGALRWGGDQVGEVEWGPRLLAASPGLPKQRFWGVLAVDNLTCGKTGHNSSTFPGQARLAAKVRGSLCRHALPAPAHSSRARHQQPATSQPASQPANKASKASKQMRTRVEQGVASRDHLILDDVLHLADLQHAAFGVWLMLIYSRWQSSVLVGSGF